MNSTDAPMPHAFWMASLKFCRSDTCFHIMSGDP